MRTLSATLEAAQQVISGRVPYLRIYCDLPFGSTFTFGTDRVLKIWHREEPYMDKATILLDNSDKYFNSRDLKGAEVSMGLGYTTGAGDEYSAGHPLKVRTQTFHSEEGVLTCELKCYGKIHDLSDQGAWKLFTASDETIRELINEIYDKTTPSYSLYDPETLSYDGSLDDIINTTKPGSSYNIKINESRLDATRRLLDMTYCVMRPEGDEELHIFRPTTSGTSYDYEYALDSHVFWSKTQSSTCTLPNLVYVRTGEDADPYYEGHAQHTDWIYYDKIIYTLVIAGLTSDAEGDKIAEAIISRFTSQNIGAGATVPVNVGAEIYDYVKITDSREGTSVTGNVGVIITTYEDGKFDQEIYLGGWLVKPWEQLPTVSDNESAPVHSYSRPTWVEKGAIETGASTTHILVPHRSGSKGIWANAVVQTAPVGCQMIIDINYADYEGTPTTIFTDQNHRIAINDGETQGFTENIDVKDYSCYGLWTMEVDQVGSTTPGSNLTVTLIAQDNEP